MDLIACKLFQLPKFNFMTGKFEVKMVSFAQVLLVHLPARVNQRQLSDNGPKGFEGKSLLKICLA